jgi:hypothetical protein
MRCSGSPYVVWCNSTPDPRSQYSVSKYPALMVVVAMVAFQASIGWVAAERRADPNKSTASKKHRNCKAESFFMSADPHRRKMLGRSAKIEQFTPERFTFFGL